MMAARSSTINVSSLTIDGLQLRIGIRRGSLQTPPLVIFNGIGANLELLEPFVQALPDREVLVFDAPGAGGSPAPVIPYRFPALARLARKMLDRFNYTGSVDAMGISWGGGLAQTFAFSFPQTCRRLVLVSTSAGALMVPGKLGVLTKMLSPRRYADPDFLREHAGEIYGGAYRRDPGLINRHSDTTLAPSMRGYIYQLLTVAGWTSLPWLPLLTQPTLILHGNDDPLVPLANARILAALIRRSELHVVDDGHLLLFSKAAEMGPLVGDFLQ